MKRTRDIGASSPDDRRKLASRRRLLLGGAVSLVALGTGTVALERNLSRRAQWVEHVVRSNLPGIRLDEASLSTFVREILASELFASKRSRLSMFTDGLVPTLVRRVPRMRASLERLERQVLSGFLLGSNFFRVEDPRVVLITYYGRPPACDNPFAVFT